MQVWLFVGKLFGLFMKYFGMSNKCLTSKSSPCAKLEVFHSKWNWILLNAIGGIQTPSSQSVWLCRDLWAQKCHLTIAAQLLVLVFSWRMLAVLCFILELIFKALDALSPLLKLQRFLFANILVQICFEECRRSFKGVVSGIYECHLHGICGCNECCCEIFVNVLNAGYALFLWLSVTSLFEWLLLNVSLYLCALIVLGTS